MNQLALSLIVFSCVLFSILSPIFIIFQANKSKQVLLTYCIIVSSMMIFSILISSFTWKLFRLFPYHLAWFLEIVTGSLFQEIARCVLFKLHKMFQERIEYVDRPFIDQYKLTGISACLIISGSFSLIRNMLVFSRILFIPGQLTECRTCEWLPYPMLQGISLVFLTTMDISLTFAIYFGDSFDTIMKISIATLLHLMVALISLINTIKDGCMVSIPLYFILTALIAESKFDSGAFRRQTFEFQNQNQRTKAFTHNSKKLSKREYQIFGKVTRRKMSS